MYSGAFSQGRGQPIYCRDFHFNSQHEVVTIKEQLYKEEQRYYMLYGTVYIASELGHSAGNYTTGCWYFYLTKVMWTDALFWVLIHLLGYFLIPDICVAIIIVKINSIERLRVYLAVYVDAIMLQTLEKLPLCEPIMAGTLHAGEMELFANCGLRGSCPWKVLPQHYF